MPLRRDPTHWEHNFNAVVGASNDFGSLSSTGRLGEAKGDDVGSQHIAEYKQHIIFIDWSSGHISSNSRAIKRTIPSAAVVTFTNIMFI